MTKTGQTAISAALLLAAAMPVRAQSNDPAAITQPGPARVTTPGAPDTTVVKPGGIDNGGPGSVGTEARSGLGADSRSNNSGADANSGKPELAVPNAGGGGGR